MKIGVQSTSNMLCYETLHELILSIDIAVCTLAVFACRSTAIHRWSYAGGSKPLIDMDVQGFYLNA